MAKDEKKVLVIDCDEQGLMVNGLMDFRNHLLSQDKPTDDVNNLIIHIIDAPPRKARRAGYEAR